MCFAWLLFTQTFDLVLNRTVSSRRLSCVPPTCVLPCQVTFYYLLGDQYSIFWPKLGLIKHLIGYSREPSHRGDFLEYTHHVFCLAMFTQRFDLVLNRTVSSRRLSCVTSTCVVPCQVTFYYCLGDQYSIFWPKL